MASKRAARRRSCGTKRRFDTRADAAVEARRLRINAYRCVFCGGWHIGHASRRTISAARQSRRDRAPKSDRP